MLKAIVISVNKRFEDYNIPLMEWIQEAFGESAVVFRTMASYEKWIMENPVPDVVLIELSGEEPENINRIKALHDQRDYKGIVYLAESIIYAQKAFDTEVIDYLLYPFNESRFNRMALKINKRYRIIQ